MMDMDPAIIKAPYHEERMIDGEKEVMMIKSGIERPHLVLYMRPTCPYCMKIMDYLKREGKKIPTKDIGANKNGANELITIGGKKQVPCLVINGKAMYESSDILNWLKSHKDKY